MGTANGCLLLITITHNFLTGFMFYFKLLTVRCFYSFLYSTFMRISSLTQTKRSMSHNPNYRLIPLGPGRVVNKLTDSAKLNFQPVILRQRVLAKPGQPISFNDIFDWPSPWNIIISDNTREQYLKKQSKLQRTLQNKKNKIFSKLFIFPANWFPAKALTAVSHVAWHLYQSEAINAKP